MDRFSPVGHQLSAALGLWAHFFPLAFCLAWSFPGLVHAATAPGNSYVHIPCCVSETLRHYSLYLPDGFWASGGAVTQTPGYAFNLFFAGFIFIELFFFLWSEKTYLNFKACDGNILSTGTDNTENVHLIYDLTSLRQINKIFNLSNIDPWNL